MTVDDVYWCWEKMYNQVLDDHALIRSFKRRSHTRSPFITNEVRQCIRQRDATKKIYYKTRSSTDWEKYRKLRNKVVKMRRKATKEHFQQLCKEKRGDQKKFWKTIKPYINARKNQNTRGETITLKDNGEIIRDQQQVSEILNTFFASVSSKMDNGTQPNLIDLSNITQNQPEPLHMCLTKTNALEVKNIMSDIKANKATGSDRIPPRAVKESAEVLCHPFSTLANYIFDKGEIPQQWKQGEITPVFKKDCCLDKSNYRPVTVLPSLSKIFGTLVHNRVSPKFERIYHKILSLVFEDSAGLFSNTRNSLASGR
ncbi:RNA-directed DNA polymerase from mobile element jockey [Exaiptasia diaphana]|nr:RNA-directed DNA polymerase from mobile element jockey [Exaiptasia diaphana]